MGVMEFEKLAEFETSSAELILDDGENPFESSKGYLSIETPLDRLFAEHRSKKTKIEAFSELANEKAGGILNYFVEASNVNAHDRGRYLFSAVI